MKITVERNTIILLSLISLTLLTSFFLHSKYAVFIILFFSSTKLNVVAFQFMELRNAHRIWKIIFGLFIFLLISIIMLILL